MTQLTIRQSGGANIISIPKAVLKALNLHIGSFLELSIENHKIILSPVIEEELTLEKLLAESPKERLTITDEDKSWLDETPKGKEI